MPHTLILLASFLMAFQPASKSWASEPKAAEPETKENAVKREVQSLYDGQDSYDPIEEDTASTSSRPRAKTKSGIGTQISFYYDGLSTFDQTFANSLFPDTYTHQSFNGISGIQIMGGYAHKRWEFMTGVDYSFPVSIQGQNGLVQHQDLEVMGIKAAQIGYRIPEGNLMIIPYGGFGLYYGRNILKVLMGTGTQNVITHVKFMATAVGGVRLDYNFTKDGSFVGGLGVEVFMPVKLADHLAQAGTVGLANSEFPGYGPQLQSRMEFMNNVGGRLLATVAAFF